MRACLRSRSSARAVVVSFGSSRDRQAIERLLAASRDDIVAASSSSASHASSLGWLALPDDLCSPSRRIDAPPPTTFLVSQRFATPCRSLASSQSSGVSVARDLVELLHRCTSTSRASSSPSPSLVALRARIDELRWRLSLLPPTLPLRAPARLAPPHLLDDAATSSSTSIATDDRAPSIDESADDDVARVALLVREPFFC